MNSRMNTFRNIFSVIALMLLVALAVYAQTTSVTLPTSDNTSSFEVKQEGGTIVFGAAGDGNVTINGTLSTQNIEAAGNATVGGSVDAATFIGDGSTLSNVVPKIAYTQGDHEYFLGDTQFHAVRSVSITVPARGVINVTANGFLDWESKGWDLFYGAILQDPYDANTYPGRDDLFRYMVIVTDFACADSSDQYSGLTMSRNFVINSAGTYTFSVWGSKYSSSARTRVHDIVMTAMYFPTGGAGAARAALPEETPAVIPKGTGLAYPD